MMDILGVSVDHSVSKKDLSHFKRNPEKRGPHLWGQVRTCVCELFVSSNKQLVFCPPVQNNQFSPGRIFFKDSKTQPQRIEFRWNHFWQQHGGPWNAKNHQKDLRFCARIARKCSFVFRVCNALWVFRYFPKNPWMNKKSATCEQ